VSWFRRHLQTLSCLTLAAWMLVFALSAGLGCLAYVDNHHPHAGISAGVPDHDADESMPTAVCQDHCQQIAWSAPQLFQLDVSVLLGLVIVTMFLVLPALAEASMRPQPPSASRRLPPPLPVRLRFTRANN